MHWNVVLKQIDTLEAISEKDKLKSSDYFLFKFPLMYVDPDGAMLNVTQDEFMKRPNSFIAMNDLRNVAREARLKLGMGSYRGMILMNGAVAFDFGSKECKLQIYAIDIKRVRAWNRLQQSQ